MRVIVCGEPTDKKSVIRALTGLPRGTVVVHRKGDAKLADSVWESWGGVCEVLPIDKMIVRGARYCFAFPGADPDIVMRAEKARIQVKKVK